MSLRASWLALAFSLAFATGCSVDGHFERPEWSLERMLDQRRADAYDRSNRFSDRRVIRALPDGVVAASDVLGPPELVEGKTSRGAYVETIPIPLTRATLAEGRRRYGIVCAACHGLLGDGRSHVALYMSLKKPVSFHTDDHRSKPPGRVFEVITHGSGLMPSYAVELDVEARWAVVAYVKALELSRRAEVATLPDAIRRELAQEAP